MVYVTSFFFVMAVEQAEIGRISGEYLSTKKTLNGKL
jgi:hypothetical protein